MGGGNSLKTNIHLVLCAKSYYSVNIRGMCVHNAHELAMHGWVAPCVRRGMGWDASACASRGRKHAKTSIRFLFLCFDRFSAKNHAICVHLAREMAVHGWVAPCGAGLAKQRDRERKRDAARRGSGRQFPLTSSKSRVGKQSSSYPLVKVLVDFMILSSMTKIDASSTCYRDVKC